MSPRAVYINWPISSFYGWGVYGLNLAIHWAADPDLAAACAHPLLARNVVVDALQLRALDAFISRSAAFHAQLAPFKDQQATVEAPVVSYFDGAFLRVAAAHGVWLEGQPTIAATFFETTQIAPDALARAANFPRVVTGSTWNSEILRALVLTNVRQVIQGVDPMLFHPGPRRGDLPGRFLVFSGGKLERRKGQDLVVAAFRRFAARHPDALLVTAWNNPWNVFASSLNAGEVAAPLPTDGQGGIDIAGWMAANGIGPDNYLDLGMPPNATMPALLREMDVALFPNRAEGGTNLVAMEAMACGVPTILSRNTGHTDLIEDENCYPLVEQRPLSGEEAGFGGVAGWGESDIDEIVEALERVYAHREEARQRGLAGAATLGQFTWARTAREMKALVLEACA
jgi:glycosyltransferase involved in cell wall biosynthesis